MKKNAPRFLLGLLLIIVYSCKPASKPKLTEQNLQGTWNVMRLAQGGGDEVWYVEGQKYFVFEDNKFKMVNTNKQKEPEITEGTYKILEEPGNLTILQLNAARYIVFEYTKDVIKMSSSEPVYTMTLERAK